jgi:hypothetical protein
MDWIRAAYYFFMVKTGLADTYRNEQFFPKLDFFYNFERNMLAVNFNNPDKGKVARNLVVHLNYNLKEAIRWLDCEG